MWLPKPRPPQKNHIDEIKTKLNCPQLSSFILKANFLSTGLLVKIIPLKPPWVTAKLTKVIYYVLMQDTALGRVKLAAYIPGYIDGKEEDTCLCRSSSSLSGTSTDSCLGWMGEGGGDKAEAGLRGCGAGVDGCE